MSTDKILNEKKTMPVIFSGHGSPMNAIGENRARDGWRETGEYITKEYGKPKAILAISAHWTTRGLYIRRDEKNPQINDMYGFPKELYDVSYEPPGSVEIADKVLKLLGDRVAVNNDWGIDHGVWSILNTMFPDADIPVVIMSTDITKSGKELFDIGNSLKTLREDGVLIIASGNVVHNLSKVNWGMADGYDWANDFDILIRDSIKNKNMTVAVNFTEIEDYKLSIPTLEHYYPLLVSLGAVNEEDSVKVFNEYRELGSMSMTSYLFE